MTRTCDAHLTKQFLIKKEFPNLNTWLSFFNLVWLYSLTLSFSDLTLIFFIYYTVSREFGNNRIKLK